MLSESSYWAKRYARHLTLAALALALVGLGYAVSPPPDIRHRLSMATAYAGLMFLAVSLCLGPWRVLRKRPNPVSFDLRRDVGIWAGVLAIAHTVVGLTVHLRGRMWMYFLKRLHPPALQDTQFGAANFAGLAGALILLLLLAISNDVSMRRLGTQRWKSMQRWIYAAFAFTVLHGIAYQVVEKRRLPWVVVFFALTIAVVAMQLAGVRSIRARRTQTK